MLNRKRKVNGGARPNAGRKSADPSGKKRERLVLYVTADEAAFLTEALEYRRSRPQEPDSDF